MRAICSPDSVDECFALCRDGFVALLAATPAVAAAQLTPAHRKVRLHSNHSEQAYSNTHTSRHNTPTGTHTTY